MSGLTYSANGYIATISMRSCRTLLVEGSGDKKVLHRLLIQLSGDDYRRNAEIVIDSSELIRECPGVVSNREKVEYIHSLVTDHAKLGGWVDREFRMFVVDQVVKDELATHNVLHASLFWTRGHSVENYFFDTRIILKYLQQNYPEHLPSRYRASVEPVMGELTRIAASTSLAARDLNLISRMNAFFSAEHWTIKEGLSVELNEESIRLALSQRGVESAQTEAFVQGLRRYNSVCRCSSRDVCKWVAHGHIGLSVLWSGVGAILKFCGLNDASLIRKISQGDWDLKYRVAADEWSQMTVDGSPESPDALVGWLRMT